MLTLIGEWEKILTDEWGETVEWCWPLMWLVRRRLPRRVSGDLPLVTPASHKCTNIELFDDLVMIKFKLLMMLPAIILKTILGDENISVLTMCDVVWRDILAVLASSAHLTIGSSDEKTYWGKSSKRKTTEEPRTRNHCTLPKRMIFRCTSISCTDTNWRLTISHVWQFPPPISYPVGMYPCSDIHSSSILL